MKGLNGAVLLFVICSTCCSVFGAPPSDDTCWGVLPDQTILKPYPGDCSKFYECEGMYPVEMACPEHLYFDESKQLCDWPSLVNCEEVPDNSTTSKPSPPPPEGDDDPRCVDGNTTYWPHPVDCAKYIECYNSKGYEMNCPSGLYFNAHDAKCENPSDSNCGASPSPSTAPSRPPGWTRDPDCPDDSGQYLFPHHTDCTLFWECFAGEKTLEHCPDGLYFNPTYMVCDYPYQAGCVIES